MCIYFFSEGASRPNAIYVGQTTRDIYQRLGEHSRGVRRESDNRMRDLLKEGGMLHVFSVPAAADYLNGLEKAGCNWINENCINMEIINVTGAGGNHCAKKIDHAKAECAKVYLPRITSLGDKDPQFSLKSVSKDLDKLESKMTGDELKDIDDLAKVISSNEDIRKEIQACQSVVIDTTGEAHILTGGKILLAARRAGRDEAFGNVTVTYDMSASRNHDRLMKQEIIFVRELRNNLPKRQFDKLADIGKEKFLRKHPENRRNGTHYVKLEALASLLVNDCPGKNTVQKYLKTYAFANEQAELAA